MFMYFKERLTMALDKDEIPSGEKQANDIRILKDLFMLNNMDSSESCSAALGYIAVEFRSLGLPYEQCLLMIIQGLGRLQHLWLEGPQEEEDTKLDE